MTQELQTIDYDTNPIILNKNDVLKLIDSDANNWDNLN